MSSKGFSLIEMVLVLILVAIITVSAAPAVTETIYNAWDQQRYYMVQTIQSGINIEYGNRMLTNSASGYPPTLDSASAGACGSGNACFDLVNVNDEEFDGDWSKVNSSTYTFDSGPSTFTYTYNSSTGKFTQTGEVSNF